MTGELLSLNIGPPREVTQDGVTVRTGIFKEPVQGRRLLRRTNIDGDGQADLENHGGESKAACAYSQAHYAHWEHELQRGPFPFGQFGENFTLRGLTEDAVHLGDVFRVGGATVEVSQPRLPCSKLGLRMQDNRFPKRFLRSLRTGFYLRVLEEGEVGAGDVMERLETGPGQVTVREACRLLHFDRADRAGIQRVLEVPALSPDWRREFDALLA
jgi:MOSC domain-containing protein YiiM